MGFIKRIKWPGWLVLMLIFVVGISVIYQSMNKETEALKSKPVMNSTTTISTKEYESEFPGLHLRTETEETDHYTISISIPTADSETINSPIQTWIEQQKDAFFSEINENNQSSNDQFDAHLNIQLDTEKVGEDLYSLVFTSYQYLGGANGETHIQPFMLNMKEDNVLQLQDFFNDQLDEQLYTLAIEQVENDAELKVFLFDDLLEEQLQELNQLKWTINQKSLTLYFNEYEIAAGAAGAVEINIPLEKLNLYAKGSVPEPEKDEPPEPEENEDQDQNDEEQEDQDEQHEQEKPKPDPDTKYVALTFDDGPSAEVTPRILETLEQYDAKATFFMLGSQVEYYPAVAKQVADAGHEIANHTTNHSDLSKLPYGAIEQQFNETSQAIEQATGVKPTLLRPPYGAYDENVVAYADNYQNSIVLWSVDSLDWQNRNATAVYQNIINSVTNGSIVLMHDIYPSTADALSNLLASLTEDGYEFVTVSELLSLHEKVGTGPHSGK